MYLYTWVPIYLPTCLALYLCKHTKEGADKRRERAGSAGYIYLSFYLSTDLYIYTAVVVVVVVVVVVYKHTKKGADEGRQPVP